MTVIQAGEIELGRMKFYAVPPYIPESCNLCGTVTELRCGVCWACQEKVETDMKEVWEIANSNHRWPYMWSTGYKVVHDAIHG